MRLVGVDYETFPINSTTPCPAPVCLATAELNGPSKLYEATRARKEILSLLRDPDVHLVGANLAFDAVVSMMSNPETIPHWFQKMEEKALHDVRIREALDLLATVGDPDAGKGGGVHSLAHLALRNVGIKVEKGDDTWRLRFGELAHLRAEDYPQAAKDYVLKDADLPVQIMTHQKDRRPEWLHVNAAICYFLMTVRGLKVNRKTKEAIQAQVEHDLHPNSLPLLYRPMNGLPALIDVGLPERDGKVRQHDPACKRKPGCDCPMKRLKAVPPSTRVNEVLKPRIILAAKSAGIPVPRNFPTEAEKARAEAEGREPVGSIKTDDATLSLLAPFDPVLAQEQKFKHLDKLRTSYFPALEWPYGSGRTAPRSFCGYDYIKKTGRGSGRGNNKKNSLGKKPTSNYPSVAIQLADPRVRWVYEPTGPTEAAPEGYVYLVADYSAIDLCCLAQTIKDLYGSSTLLDQINNGINPHTFLATVLAYENDRKFRKAVDGMSEDEAYAFFKSLENTDRPEYAGFYKEWRDLAKTVGLGFAGGMGINTLISVFFKATGRKITREQARSYRETWMKIYPEMKWYLRKWVPSQKDYTGEWHQYKSPLGMLRVRCSYTECANGRALQSPAAEGMKMAMWLVTRACYDPSQDDILFGCYPVINMHDELVLEVPRLRGRAGRLKMHAQAKRLEELMNQGMAYVLHDVKTEAKPYYTTRWVKEAKQVLDDEGLISVWEPTPGMGPEHEGVA